MGVLAFTWFFVVSWKLCRGFSMQGSGVWRDGIFVYGVERVKAIGQGEGSINRWVECEVAVGDWDFN